MSEFDFMKVRGCLVVLTHVIVQGLQPHIEL
jgi:hypothetical protein